MKYTLLDWTWLRILALGFMCCGVSRAAITIQTLPVGNVGNAADGTGYGQVNYAYNIGKYEVTAGQYGAFLNAVAATDIYGLYNPSMANTAVGSGISRSGVSGSYSYTVDTAFVNRPVNYVSIGDAMRFVNWLQNGQPFGAQSASTTEDGAYFVNGATSSTALLAVTRKGSWTWALPSEDEWYKAAYYSPATGGYYLYATSSNADPGRDILDTAGNNANYNVEAGPYPIELGKYTTEVGKFQNSRSPYGTYDQSGNVWEMNEARFSATARGLRGGSFQSVISDLRSSTRTGITPLIEVQNIGFRVSEVPEPASVAFMGIFASALLARRNRWVRRNWTN